MCVVALAREQAIHRCSRHSRCQWFALYRQFAAFRRCALFERLHRRKINLSDAVEGRFTRWRTEHPRRDNLGFAGKFCDRLFATG
jgi:hypothetical protein